MANITTLVEKLNNNQVVLLDGATGTELQHRGVHTTLPLWSAQALLNSPQTVKEVHRDYVLAGADIVKTNTFRTNKRTLAKAGMAERDFELTKFAVDLAKEAVVEANVDRDVYIGGVQTTLEDCYEPSLVPPDDIALDEHRRWSKNLADSGVDFIFLETFNTIRESKAALQAAAETGLPVIFSFMTNGKGELFSGEPINEMVKVAESFKPIAILLNCMQPEAITKDLTILRSLTSLPIGAYGQGVGAPADDEGWSFEQERNGIDEYCNHVGEWLNDGATLVGGCCGTNPAYVEAIKTLALRK